MSVLTEFGNLENTGMHNEGNQMEFAFEVDPTRDIAIGMEIASEDTDLELEDFDLSAYDPMSATGAKPGSEDKVKMLAARYAAGVPLWHDSDCYDHGPAEVGDAFDETEDEFDLDL